MADVKGIEVRLFERDKVVFEKKLGSGTFGKVYLATITNSNLPQVAVKVFRQDLMHGEISEKDKENAYEELLKLAVIDHENVVKLHGMVQNELPWLVFEFMKDGNLLEYVKKNDDVKEKTLTRFCRDICNGMAFLHSHHVLHKDLAARNILLHGKTAKISDLGLSSFLTNNDYGIYALNGKMFPFRHAAVECIVEQVFTFESDVWSFGILMYEIFTGGMVPYGKDNKEPEVRRFIVDHITPIHLLEPTCSSKVYGIMRSILNPILTDRPTFSQLHQKFQKLLNEKSTPPDHQSTNGHDPNVSAAFSAFHQIKASGLSSSFSNLHPSPGSSTTNLHLPTPSGSSPPLRDNHLSVVGPSHPTSARNLSHSTSDLLNVGTGIRPQRNRIFLPEPNLLAVRTPPNNHLSKRHSIHLGESSSTSPLSSSLKEDSPLQNYLPENEYEEPRQRSSSASRHQLNPLLQGFVQNRFIRRKS